MESSIKIELLHGKLGLDSYVLILRDATGYHMNPVSSLNMKSMINMYVGGESIKISIIVPNQDQNINSDPIPALPLL